MQGAAVPLAASMATLGIAFYVLPAQAPGGRVHQLSSALMFLTSPFCPLCSPERHVLSPLTDE